MIVGTPAHEAKSSVLERCAQPCRVSNGLLLVADECRFRRVFEAHSLGCDDVHERAALHAGKECSVNGFSMFFTAEHEATSWATERFVCGRGDDIGVWHRTRVHAGCDEACDMGHVGDHSCTDRICDPMDAFEVDRARVGTGTDHDQLGRMRVG